MNADSTIPKLIVNTNMTLTPLAIVNMVERNAFYLKLKSSHLSVDRFHWIPLTTATEEQALKKYLLEKVGYVGSSGNDQINAIKNQVVNQRVPRIRGTSRLGWTSDGDAYIYDGTVFPVGEMSGLPYEFVAPEGTIMKHAAEAYSPHGERDAQYRGFRKLWRQSWEFRVVLSLATVSPFLEPLGAPSIPFHVAGPSGWGKTTLLRLAISAFADPDSALSKVDFSKDTQNYADAQLGILRNFPILLDETTLRSPEDIATAAYNIAVGRTKGRLGGSEQLYLPTEPMAYALVCFLSGETPLRDHFDQKGAAARFSELVLQQPIFQKTELPVWWAFPTTHSGWYGQDLIRTCLDVYFANGQKGDMLKQLHDQFRHEVAAWCDEHSRMLDLLSLAQLGHYLTAKLLFHEMGFVSKPDHQLLLGDARSFGQELYKGLNKATRLDQVVGAIRELTEIDWWIERGFIPLKTLERVAHEFDMAERGKLATFLSNQGVVSKVESRKIQGEQSVRLLHLVTRGERVADRVRRRR